MNYYDEFEDGDEVYIDGDERIEELQLEYQNDSVSDESGDDCEDDDEELAQLQTEAVDGNGIELKDDSIQGFFAHKEPVFTIAIHPLLPLVASGGGDDKSYLWDYSTGDLVSYLGQHTDSVVSCAFSNDGRFLASGGMDGQIFIFEIIADEFNSQGMPDGILTKDINLTVKEILLLEGPSEVIWLDWHPRGNILLVGSEDGTVWMYSIPTGKCMNVFTGHIESCTCGSFTSDGKFIVTGSNQGSIIIWDPKTGSALHKWTSADLRFHQASITSLKISPDSSVIVSGAQDGSIRLLQSHSFKILGSLESHSDSVESIGFSKEMNLIATGGVDGKIHVSDSFSMKRRYTINHSEAITMLRFADSTLIASSIDGNIMLWDAKTGILRSTLHGHQNSILDFAISKDLSTVITASDDGTSLVFALI